MKEKVTIFDFFVYLICILALLIALVPFLYILSMSISDPLAAAGNKVFLWPVGFSLSAYKTTLGDPALWTSFFNTLWYTIVGTGLGVIVTILGAYPLSKSYFVGKKFFTFFFVFTMFFSGGLIPLFITVNKLGLYNTRWAVILPGLVATFNLIICRTYFQSLPEEVFESARIDGCGEIRILWRILIPLSKPIIAVLVLFYGIANWNNWFSASLFLSDSKMYPLQLYLRGLLIQNSSNLASSAALTGTQHVLSIMQVRYAAIIIACVPILAVYPVLQRYFVKGIMIGSLKG